VPHTLHYVLELSKNTAKDDRTEYWGNYSDVQVPRLVGNFAF
jgi:hypothetical protein